MTTTFRGQTAPLEIKLPKIVEDLRLWARKDGFVPLFAIWWPKNEPGLAEIPEEFTYHMQKGTSWAGSSRTTTVNRSRA